MTECSVTGCADISEARGMCKRHYMRWLRRPGTDITRTLYDRREPMVCECPAPEPVWLSECGRCHRPIRSLMTPGCGHRLGGPGQVCGRHVEPPATRCPLHLPTVSPLPSGQGAPVPATGAPVLARGSGRGLPLNPVGPATSHTTEQSPSNGVDAPLGDC